MKNIAVVFTKNNARVLKYEDIKDVKDLSHIVLNPSLKDVIGVKPHHWKFVAGRIVPMSKEEMDKRDSDILACGADNSIIKSDGIDVDEFKKINDKEIADRLAEEERRKNIDGKIQALDAHRNAHKTEIGDLKEGLKSMDDAISSLVDSIQKSNKRSHAFIWASIIAMYLFFVASLLGVIHG